MIEHRELRAIFGNDFSKPSFRVIDDELRLVGKHGELSLNDDGTFDVWIVEPDREPMNGLRLSTIIGKAEKHAVDGLVHKLDGEAWLTIADKDKAVKCGSLIGIKRKRVVSDKVRQAARERFIKRGGFKKRGEL